MKITEKQLQILIRVLEGSLKIADRTDMNIFGFDIQTRKDIYHQLINQQSDELIEVTENKEPIDSKRQAVLDYDIETYNKAMEIEWIQHKKTMNLSGDLSTCEYCGRKYSMCCICDEAEKRWNNMMQEVREVSERNNRD